MLISETAAISLRRLKVLSNILSSTNNSIQYLNKRTYSDLTSNNEVVKNDSEATHIKIGDVVKEIKKTKSTEKVPKGYMSLYGGIFNESQPFLKHLKWLMQKDELRQDMFLIGSPPGAWRRQLAMYYAELTKREVEYLCLTRDTTESDIKQRREVISGSVIYTNQCAVSAALNGRLLIIEGIEKAERNLLPILNNLLENRELNLDDGHFLISPDRYDKLVELAKKDNVDLAKLNLLRVHEDFRVLAIGLPVPKYKGNPLDPPLRSRFQARLVNYPTYEDHLKYLTTLSSNNPKFIESLLSFSYSFYDEEIVKLNLPDFPIENIDKLVRIVDNCKVPNSLNKSAIDYLNVNSLLNKIYPYRILLKTEESNLKLYYDLLKRFNLSLNNENEINYKLLTVENHHEDPNKLKVKFESSVKTFKQTLEVALPRGSNFNIENSTSEFIMNDYHSQQLVELLLSHSANHDICLIGGRGVGKSALVKQFSKLLGYNYHTIQLYKDMTSRDLIQQRITMLNGDTKWINSVLIDACINGDICIIDGIHRVRDDTLLALRRLVQDRELDLMDGKTLIRHDKYDLLENKANFLRIHPSFRLIAIAEPPAVNEKSTAATSVNWLTSEITNMFLFHTIEPLSVQHEFDLLNKKFNLNEQHKKLFDIVHNLKQLAQDDPQLKQTASLFSLRQLIRLSKKLEAYPNLNLKDLIESSCLYKFMPQLNKQVLNEFLKGQNIVDQPEANDVDSKQLLGIFNEYKLDNENIYDLAKVPETLFFENKLHTRILHNLLRDFKLGEHLLLIGNQGTGKNKLTDKFLMLLNRPREYIQLHRDTTVHSLTVQPQIRSGVVTYEDSPLVKAVKAGHILVIDEADKANVQVTCILKSLIETGEMLLSDGRLIVPYSSKKIYNQPNIIQTHKNFRIIVLANRPGFPFLGNDFFGILGDLLSCHQIDNPDILSEIELLKMYAPNVSDQVLQKLVNAFNSLRELSDQGLITYPYSTRELVNIVKHLEKYPSDSLSNVVSNISDFDQFHDLKTTFKQIMNKHGIPVSLDQQVSINLTKPLPMPAILPLASELNFESLTKTLKFTDSQLNWKHLGELTNVRSGADIKIDKKEERVNSFNELRASWHLPVNKQNIINDFLLTNTNGDDLAYVFTLKPMSLLKFNLAKNEQKLVDLSKYFPLAWRTYYPRIKLHASTANSNEVYLFDEVLNNLFKVDFEASKIYELNRTSFMNKAKKTMSKYFTDQNQIFKLSPLQATKDINGDFFVSHKVNSNQIEFINMAKSYQIELELNFKIFSALQINPNQLLIVSKQNDKPNYYLLNFSNTFFNLEANFTNDFTLYKLDNLLNSNDDLLLGQINYKNAITENFRVLFNDKVTSTERISTVLPSIFNHFVVAKDLSLNSKPETYFCRRDNSIEENHSKRNVLPPIVQSIVNYKTNTIITQLPLYVNVPSLTTTGSKELILGYLEILDLNDKTLRYLEIPKATEQQNLLDDSNFYLNVVNEANYLLQVSNANDSIYTLDFNGCLREWEISKLNLERSLDEWYKLVTDRENQKLSVDYINKASTSDDTLKDLNGPKHGKTDLNNAPHVGGNTWAGGSGGRDTAGLGGVGGPYRLDSGNTVFQVSDEAKQQVPEHVRKAAREMAQKAFRERLREIEMSEYEHSVYTKYLENVKKPIQQLRNILNGLEAKKKERQWLKHQTSGDLDDTKLVEAITGEKNVYKKRGEDPNAMNELEMEKPKRLKLVIDVSGSMYRFNGVDGRLERELEAILMVMEAFSGYENKIRYDIVGHSGDGYDLKFTDAMTPPNNEAERLKVLKKIIAHAQFCSSGDHTLEATKYSIETVAKEEADDYFCVVLSDANFDRYGISPRSFTKIMLNTDPKVNSYCIFIGSLGDQAINLKKNLPFGKAFVCMNTQDIPKIMQQIFQSALLKD